MSTSIRNQINETGAALNNLACMPHPALGIDVDGTVDSAPIFFNILTNCWKGKVFVITYRTDRENTIKDLVRYNIRYDELILVKSFEAKAEAIVENQIMFFFDDQPEMVKHVPPTATVFLVRNEGNFCFDEKLWMLSEQTARLV